MSQNVAHVKAAIAHARKATVLLKTWEKKTYPPGAAEKTEWGQFWAELNQVTDDPGSGDGEGIPAQQVALYVPKVNRYTAEQWVNVAKPEFWIEGVWGGQWEFFIDGVSHGVFTGSNGSAGGVAKTPLSDDFHVIQAFSRGLTPELVSHKTTFLVDTKAPDAPQDFTVEVFQGWVSAKGRGATAYERVEMRVGPSAGGANQVNADGTWQTNSNAPLPSGTYAVTVRFTDKHVNVGPWSAPMTVTVP